ncbi:MAG: phosphoglyceromutase [Acidimicrobiia bacterium]|nr:phosphoglyceromutase [Acidimicrobiia bacterium]
MPTLILLRHGQSTWNRDGLFTGWVDVNLTDQGEAEAARAGDLLLEHGLAPDLLHTSLQRRAIRTAEIALAKCDRTWIPVRRSWRLNERHYGALQGKDKRQTTDEFGAEQVKIWRRSFDVRPPELEGDASADPRYADVPADQIPRAECLADVVARMLPYWTDDIVADLRTGKTVLVAAHGNSLRALVMHLDGLSKAEVVELNIPTGQPLAYEFDNQMRVRSSRYLDPAAAAAGAAVVAKQAG